MIIPIVYYEGKENWTADMRLSDRIAHAEYLEEYIPDYFYTIISVHTYTNEELIERNNEMALIMMINKIQDKDGFHEFRMTARDFMKSIFDRTTADIRDLILDVLWGLFMKIGVTDEEAARLLGEVKGGEDMGILFENFEVYDYRAVNEELKKERIRSSDLERQLADDKAEIDKLKRKILELEQLTHS